MVFGLVCPAALSFALKKNSMLCTQCQINRVSERMASKEKALEKLEKQKRSLECKNLHDYLKTLPNEVLDQLYNTPATCLAVFRELPALAKQFVMRLLHVHQAVPKTVVASWVVHAFAKESARSQEVLTSLRLWYGATLPGGLEAWLLNGTFRCASLYHDLM